MAASRFLGTTAACAIILSFAAEHRKSHWNGCIKVAMAICSDFFLILALVIFLLKVVFKDLQNRAFLCLFHLFSALASRSGFGPVASCAVVHSCVVHNCIVFCNALSANRTVVAASRFLGATAACAMPLCS